MLINCRRLRLSRKNGFYGDPKLSSLPVHGFIYQKDKIYQGLSLQINHNNYFYEFHNFPSKLHNLLIYVIKTFQRSIFSVLLISPYALSQNIFNDEYFTSKTIVIFHFWELICPIQQLQFSIIFLNLLYFLISLFSTKFVWFFLCKMFLN